VLISDKNSFSVCKQRGQSMVEFIIIFPILLILTLGTFQFALIYNAKTTLNYATFHAARNGAVSNADKETIDAAFYRGLAPLYTSIDGDLSNVQEVQAGRDKVRATHDQGFICIQRINPTEMAFVDFAVNADGTIPNNNLMYRSAKIGANSQLSIQDANLLKLRVTYCHPLIVPFMSNMLRAMANGTATGGETIDTGGNLFLQNCYENGRIPIVSQAIVRMQSDIKNDIFPDCTTPLP
jgi:Flp pilus assembly protein TadG